MKCGGDVEGFMQNPGKIKFRGSVPPGGRGGLGRVKNRKKKFELKFVWGRREQLKKPCECEKIFSDGPWGRGGWDGSKIGKKIFQLKIVWDIENSSKNHVIVKKVFRTPVGRWGRKPPMLYIHNYVVWPTGQSFPHIELLFYRQTGFEPYHSFWIHTACFKCSPVQAPLFTYGY